MRRFASVLGLLSLAACAPDITVVPMHPTVAVPTASSRIGEVCRGTAVPALRGEAAFYVDAELRQVRDGVLAPAGTVVAPANDDEDTLTMANLRDCTGISMRTRVRSSTLADGGRFLDLDLAIKPVGSIPEGQENGIELTLQPPAGDSRFTSTPVASRELNLSAGGENFVVDLTVYPGPSEVRHDIEARAAALAPGNAGGGFSVAFPDERPGATLSDVTIGGAHIQNAHPLEFGPATTGGFGAPVR